MQKYEDEKSTIIRESIGEAILTLLERFPFDEISVLAICQKAGVGRTTYYRYYGKKSGKEDAIYQWFISRWHLYIGDSMPTKNELDMQFLTFTYTLKKQLILLQENKLLHIFHQFVILLFGPSKTCTDIGQYYLACSGAGLWCGIIYAAIERNFQESPKDLVLQYQTALLRSFEQE